MSSRYLSGKISSAITPLSKDQIEKDIRHMEAYRNACRAYSQQLFVFKNQELCRSGYFGMFVPFANGAAAAGGEGVDAKQTDSLQQRAAVPAAVSSALGPSSSAHPAGSAKTNGAKSPAAAFSLPIKIDPEEEKRLSLLRKKIHQSEFTREQLETEYLSLRAHYIHESQLVRKTRAYEMGRWKLLKEIMERRGKVLALMRVKVAMGRDVEELLRYRGEVLGKAKENENVGGKGAGVRDVVKVGEKGDVDASADGKVIGGTSTTKEGDKSTVRNVTGTASAGKEDGTKQEVSVPDLIEVWNNIDAQLKEAELACIELETPSELLKMVMSPDVPNSSSSSSDRPSHNYRTRSPTRKSSSEEATDGDKDKNGGKKRSRSNSESSEFAGKEKPESALSIPPGMEPHVIPWDSVVDPLTPYDVPLLLSCLSSATDKAVGFCELCSWYG